ncbi:ladderlectin-like [Saccostrea cucullata]|uniref:ladderlectin-like n=1 Tax=Saccostrea cuccullata TaxID=36930 RepID=UPI002ED14F6D
MSVKMIFTVIGFLVILSMTKGQPLYKSSIDNDNIGVSTEVNMRDWRIFQTNMEARITKAVKKEISDNKEPDIRLLQIIERMQTELTELENKVTNTTKDMPSKSCPSNWISFGSSCYMIIAQKKSWDNAAIKCLQYGAKLVEIETKEENNFLKQRTSIYNRKEFWIGGIDEFLEGRFVWASTGSSLTFTDWNKGEPNNDKSREDCIEISRHPARLGMWNDNSCSYEFYFICEKTL